MATKANSKASTDDNTPNQTGPFLKLPTDSGRSCYVRAETVDAVEPVSNTHCHVVIDGKCLYIAMNADDCAALIAQQG